MTWDLHLPGCHSLKEKRGVLKPLTAALRRSSTSRWPRPGSRISGSGPRSPARWWERRGRWWRRLCAPPTGGRGGRRRAHRGHGDGVPMKGSSRRPGAGGRDPAPGHRRRAAPREVRDPRVGFVTVTAVLVDQRPVPRPGHGERAGRGGRAGARARRAAERRRLSPVAGRHGRSPPGRCPSSTSSSTGAWSTPPGSTSC